MVYFLLLCMTADQCFSQSDIPFPSIQACENYRDATFFGRQAHVGIAAPKEKFVCVTQVWRRYRCDDPKRCPTATVSHEMFTSKEQCERAKPDDVVRTD